MTSFDLVVMRRRRRRRHPISCFFVRRPERVRHPRLVFSLDDHGEKSRYVAFGPRDRRLRGGGGSSVGFWGGFVRDDEIRDASRQGGGPRPVSRRLGVRDDVHRQTTRRVHSNRRSVVVAKFRRDDRPRPVRNGDSDLSVLRERRGTTHGVSGTERKFASTLVLRVVRPDDVTVRLDREPDPPLVARAGDDDTTPPREQTGQFFDVEKRKTRRGVRLDVTRPLDDIVRGRETLDRATARSKHEVRSFAVPGSLQEYPPRTRGFDERIDEGLALEHVVAYSSRRRREREW